MGLGNDPGCQEVESASETKGSVRPSLSRTCTCGPFTVMVTFV